MISNRVILSKTIIVDFFTFIVECYSVTFQYRIVIFIMHKSSSYKSYESEIRKISRGLLI